MKTTLVFLCAIAALFAVSCGGKADAETIRLYANALDLYGSGRFSEAATLLGTAKTFPPALVLRAKAEYFSGDLEGAEKSCRRAIKHRPSAFEAKLFLARILRDKGEGENARNMAESLLVDNPQEIRLLRFAAALAQDRGDFAEASVFLDQAAGLSAENAMVLLDRARFRWVAGRGTEALEDLARAKAMLPWDTPIARSIASLENRIRETLQ